MALHWDSKELRVESDAQLVRKYRRLQSWYRETHLGVAPGPSGQRIVGSSLPVASHPASNFLTPAAWAHAEERIEEVPAEGGTLDVDRLRRNLLSSMPMCFNVFGSLRAARGFPQLLAALFDEEAAVVGRVTCEWAPSPKRDHLHDRSAFDALVHYATATGAERFLGIETKYTEPFSQTTFSSERYREVTEESGWFAAGATDVLQPSAANQLWRTVMLAASYAATSGRDGYAAVVCLAEDDRAAAAVDLVRGQMTDPARLLHVPLEALAAAAAENDDPAVQRWADLFSRRYLHPDRLHDSAAPGQP